MKNRSALLRHDDLLAEEHGLGGVVGDVVVEELQALGFRGLLEHVGFSLTILISIDHRSLHPFFQLLINDRDALLLLSNVINFINLIYIFVRYNKIIIYYFPQGLTKSTTVIPWHLQKISTY